MFSQSTLGVFECLVGKTMVSCICSVNNGKSIRWLSPFCISHFSVFINHENYLKIQYYFLYPLVSTPLSPNWMTINIEAKRLNPPVITGNNQRGFLSGFPSINPYHRENTSSPCSTQPIGRYPHGCWIKSPYIPMIVSQYDHHHWLISPWLIFNQHSKAKSVHTSMVPLRFR